ncbi:MAG: NHL repeat-containing protein [Chloroflexota bacterium]|nr:NHL repeat-containing protein [Chloroflexota bacterium]MDE2929459.1 NHL repeat-containing protein [Chloroflexota bacterium]
MKRLAVLLALALFFLLPISAAAAECQFVLGFATLRDLIGHDIVGECLEDQRYAANGNSEQQTTGGLLVWRKADNVTVFTDGYRTWINGPNGLEQRLNTERFPWEIEPPLVQTSAVRGVAGDLWADVIIGQPDFSQITDDQVVPYKVFNPGGVIVDRSVSPGRAYIWDAGNSRILGVDLSKCYAGSGPCWADIVLGQPSLFDHAACNGDSNVQNFPFRAAASAETLCGIPDVAISPDEEHSYVTMALDAAGNLYVPDSLNNRVLKYTRPFETDTIADEVWGQGDFTGIVCNRDNPGFAPTSDTLCFQSWELRLSIGGFASGVEIDPSGNLWVADAANHRVLRFPLNAATGVIAKQADLVLGQPSFQSSTKGFGLSQLDSPAAVRVASNGWLYVADKGNDRILVFHPPFTSGMSAASVFGSDFNRPTSLEMHPNQNSMWVNNSDAKTFELWDLNGNGTRRAHGDVPSRSGGGIGIDADANVLVSVKLFTQDVLRFPAPNADATNAAVGNADKRLFYPPGGHNFKSGRELGWVAGVAVYADQLIAADRKRLMFWNDVRNLRNGQAADGVIGETYWQQSPLTCCGRIKVDGAGRLWVLGTDTTRFIKVYQLPLTAQSVPIKTIRTEGISIPVLGTNETVWLGPTTFTIPGSGHRSSSTVTLGPYIRSIAPVGNGDMIWISDSHNHRVLRIRNPLSNPVVDVILGQKEATGNKCNRQAHFSAWDNPEDHTGPPTADMLCFPGGLAYDRLGNLYVSDHSLEVAGNKRLLIFAAGSIPIDNHSVVYAPAATKVVTELGRLERKYFAARLSRIKQ